jgi:hypothetical protein
MEATICAVRNVDCALLAEIVNVRVIKNENLKMGY